MLDKHERDVLFPGRCVNFSSLDPSDTPHFQNADITSSSYFMDMDVVEEITKKKNFGSLNSKNISGVSPVSGNNQYYDKDNSSVGQQAEFDNINKVLLSNLMPTYFQQKEPYHLHETYTDEIANLRDTGHIGHVRQQEHSGYQSESGFDLVNTFLLGQDKQCGMFIPHSPVESSTTEQARLAREKLRNNAFVSKVLESIYLGNQEALTHGHKNQSLVERSLSENASLNSQRYSVSNGFSTNMDEQNKPSKWRLSPVNSDKIWDGSLKLNTTTTVSTVAFFKSGEKVQDLNWPDHLEIKGKVRLHAFEKFIQELPRSRNRALMVISLCWKLGSCERGLAGMMEVAKGYRETERVGFAQIPTGIDLYVCPRSDIIITILAKYGFFKGMAAVEEDRDSLIGCVVWRRSQSSTNSVSLTLAEGKKALIQEQPVKSSGLSIQEMNSPSMERHASEKKFMPSETALKATLELPDSESVKAHPVTETKCLTIESKDASSSSNSHNASIFHCSNTVQTITSIPYSCPLVPAQQNIHERPFLNLLQENMKPEGIIPLAENIRTDKADLVSESWTRIVSTPQMAPLIMLQNSLSSINSQSISIFGSVPVPGPRPLIPVNSSNFQFQPQMVQNTHSASLNDSNAGSELSCSVNNPTPSFQAARPVLPGPPPLSIELLQSFIQSKSNVAEAIIDGRILQDKTQIMHHLVTKRPADVFDTRAPSVTQIRENCSGSNNDNNDSDDDDDLPEFDFNSACEEQSDAPTTILPGCIQQTHFPGATPLFNEKLSFEAANGKSFESFQHRHKSSPIPGKLLNSNEGLFLVKNFGENISKKPSTAGYQLTCQPSSMTEGKDIGNNSRHNFGSERKSLWDDDDDMPEWCPPDLELPEFNATENVRLLSVRTLSPPPSFHPSQSRGLQQIMKSGLLGPCPSSTTSAGGFIRSSKTPLESRHTDSVRLHAGKNKFKRKPRSAADHRRRRR